MSMMRPSIGSLLLVLPVATKLASACQCFATKIIHTCFGVTPANEAISLKEERRSAWLRVYSSPLPRMVSCSSSSITSSSSLNSVLSTVHPLVILIGDRRAWVVGPLHTADGCDNGYRDRGRLDQFILHFTYAVFHSDSALHHVVYGRTLL